MQPSATDVAHATKPLRSSDITSGAFFSGAFFRRLFSIEFMIFLKNIIASRRAAANCQMSEVA
jgi:hypothetical protein